MGIPFDSRPRQLQSARASTVQAQPPPQQQDSSSPVGVAPPGQGVKEKPSKSISSLFAKTLAQEGPIRPEKSPLSEAVKENIENQGAHGASSSHSISNLFSMNVSSKAKGEGGMVVAPQDPLRRMSLLAAHSKRQLERERSFQDLAPEVGYSTAPGTFLHDQGHGNEDALLMERINTAIRRARASIEADRLILESCPDAPSIVYMEDLEVVEWERPDLPIVRGQLISYHTNGSEGQASSLGSPYDGSDSSQWDRCTVLVKLNFEDRLYYRDSMRRISQGEPSLCPILSRDTRTKYELQVGQARQLMFISGGVGNDGVHVTRVFKLST